MELLSFHSSSFVEQKWQAQRCGLGTCSRVILSRAHRLFQELKLKGIKWGRQQGAFRILYPWQSASSKKRSKNSPSSALENGTAGSLFPFGGLSIGEVKTTKLFYSWRWSPQSSSLWHAHMKPTWYQREKTLSCISTGLILDLPQLLWCKCERIFSLAGAVKSDHCFSNRITEYQYIVLLAQILLYDWGGQHSNLCSEFWLSFAFFTGLLGINIL